MVYNYLEYNLLNESLILNEGFDIKTIFNMVKNIKNNNNFLSRMVNLFNSSKNRHLKKKIGVIITVFYLTSILSDCSIENRNIEKIADKVSTATVFDYKEFTKLLSFNTKTKILYPETENMILLKDPTKFKLSDEGREFIKSHEKLRLRSYDLGDNKILTGYGHFEQDTNKTFQLGDSITVEEAEILFEKDVKQKEYELKRMFKQWKNEGIEILISQEMYDAILDVAYNMGFYAFKASDFCKELKQGNFETAAEKIKPKDVNDLKFPGLFDRRMDQYKLFTKYLS